MPIGVLQDPHKRTLGDGESVFGHLPYLRGQIISVPVSSNLSAPQLSSLASLEPQKSAVSREGGGGCGQREVGLGPATVQASQPEADQR